MVDGGADVNLNGFGHPPLTYLVQRDKGTAVHKDRLAVLLACPDLDLQKPSTGCWGQVGQRPAYTALTWRNGRGYTDIHDTLVIEVCSVWYVVTCSGHLCCLRACFGNLLLRVVTSACNALCSVLLCAALCPVLLSAVCCVRLCAALCPVLLSAVCCLLSAVCCVRLCAVVCGCVRLCAAVCGCVRLCAAVCGCVRLCAAVCGCVLCCCCVRVCRGVLCC